ncbi:unnamed protein product [Urochloa humidicola]
MSGRWRSRRSSDEGSSSRVAHRHRGSTETSNTSTDHVPGRHRDHNRSSSPSSRRGSPASANPNPNPSWVNLSRAGAWRDNFAGDHTTAISETSEADEISASLDLAHPPDTSVLTLDWPQGPQPEPDSTISEYPTVISAHRGLVLFSVPTHVDYPYLADYFLYHAGDEPDRRRPPLLLRLPVYYSDERSGYPEQHNLHEKATGVLSWRGKGESSSSFLVGQLQIIRSTDVRIHLLRSGSDKWEVISNNLHIPGDSNGLHLLWWSTDAAVAYRRRFLIWVDYYRGMIVADMSPESDRWKTTIPDLRLRYVPLPVYTAPMNAHERLDDDRPNPEVSRSMCVTISGVLKFVSVDTKRISGYGIGLFRTWSSTFRVTTWSLRDDYTWRRDATMYPEDLWAALDSNKNGLPHVQPEFPVVNMENPDAVSFMLREGRGTDEKPAWMIEVDMKKRVLLGSAVYHQKTSIMYYDDHEATMRAADPSFISSDIPRYLYGGETTKKRRQ